MTPEEKPPGDPADEIPVHVRRSDVGVWRLVNRHGHGVAIVISERWAKFLEHLVADHHRRGGT